MNLTKELMSGIIKHVVDQQTTKPDVLWAVTSFRANVFCLLKDLGLTRPNESFAGSFNTLLIEDVIHDYATILSTFPAEIKYNDNEVETPRANALTRTFEVASGLVSDEKEWESAQELARLVGTNADSEHQKLDYAVLMGIVLRILDLVGIDMDVVCQNLLVTDTVTFTQGMDEKTEA